MGELDADEVMAAAAAWIWLPGETETVDNDDYLLVAMPTRLSQPTQVLRTSSVRPAADVVAEVAEHVRRWERPSVLWWCSPASRPADVEQALVAAGAVRETTVQVLARPLGEPEPVDPRFEIRTVVDADTMRDHEAVAIDAFGGTMPAADRLSVLAERLRGRYEEGVAMTVVAYLDGEPVGTGGVSVADGFGRMWSGATVESARGQGVYAAVTAARAAWAHGHGARGLLTKGRVDTSAPILRRAGFTTYGEERAYRLVV